MTKVEFSKMQEDELLLLLIEGDSKAFEEIYNRYWEYLYIAARNILNDEEVCKDILQEVFTDLWNKRAQKDIRFLKTYLYNAIRFQVANHLRHDQIKQSHLNQITTLESSNTTEELIAYNELDSTVKERLSELPHRCKEIFYLSRYRHLSNKEIAESLGISQSTVENQINKALRHLRLSILRVITILMIFFWM